LVGGKVNVGIVVDVDDDEFDGKGGGEFCTLEGFEGGECGDSSEDEEDDEDDEDDEVGFEEEEEEIEEEDRELEWRRFFFPFGDLEREE